MVDLLHQSEMTDAGSVPRAKLVKTVIGMAHFAGSGPVGESCSGCRHWLILTGRSKPICDKYRSMTGDSKKPVPGGSPACRHFVRKANG